MISKLKTRIEKLEAAAGINDPGKLCADALVHICKQASPDDLAIARASAEAHERKIFERMVNNG